MTKKKLLFGFIALCLSLILCAGAILWLVGTPAGARRTGEFLARQAGLTVAVRIVEGSILKGLTLEDITIDRNEVRTRIKSINSGPLRPFTGPFAIKELSLQGVTVQDRRPRERKPLDLNWPVAAGIMASYAGSIEALEVSDFVYLRSGEQPVAISRMSASVIWRYGRLAVRNLSLAMEQADIAGNFSADFRRPSLTADLAALFNAAATGLKKISLNIRPASPLHPEQTAGAVTIAAISSAGRHGELTGEVGLTRSSLNLRKLHFTQAGRRDVLTGAGEIAFPEGSPIFRLSAKVAHLDLASELRVKTDISGLLTLSGNLETFGGRFSLANTGKGLQSAACAGSFAGGAKQIRVASLDGLWLGGKVKGSLQIDWREGIALRGDLQGEGLNPALISPEWSGVINLALQGEFKWSRNVPLEGYVKGRLLESRLHGQALTGTVQARLSGGDVTIAALDLSGRGFDIHATGGLQERIRYRADIDDLAGFIPAARGRLHARGWLLVRDGTATFAAQGSGGDLSLSSVQSKSLVFNVFLGEGTDRLLQGDITARGLTYGNVKLSSATLAVKGTLLHHTGVVELRSSRSELHAALAGAYQSGAWQGKVNELEGRDTDGRWSLQSPAELRLSELGCSLSPLVLLVPGETERLELAANLVWQPLQGFVRATWDGINLRRADSWFDGLALSGRSSGTAETVWMGGEVKRLTADFAASGRVASGSLIINVSRATANLSWDDQALVATCEIALTSGGKFTGSLAAASPVRLSAPPENGEIQAAWQEIDASLFQGWFPRGVSLKGRLSGRIKGALLRGGLPNVAGTATLTDGVVDWQREKGRLSADLRNATMSLAWQGETASGTFDFTLGDYGQAHAAFRLPIPARLPPAINRVGSLSVLLKGRLHETGMLTAAFPGLIQESRGDMDFTIDIGGSWGKPTLRGSAAVAAAGAYLPAAGIHLNAVSLRAHLEGDQVTVDSFRAESGAGSIELKAVVTLPNGRPIAYRGTLKGARFQAIYLPELRAVMDPDLNFTGTQEQLTVRGSVFIPELTALGAQGPVPVAPSDDVIVIDAPQQKEQGLPFALDLRVRVSLGETVTVKAAGADVRLGGSVDLTAQRMDDIRAKGAIRVIQGRYRAHGVNLDTMTGRLVFDGPAGKPALDILAVRTREEITVGVLITGTLPAPVIKLYSRPRLADPDIMAYLVLGHPLRNGTEDLSLVVNAAGLLLSKGESVSLQEQLKRRLGIDTLGIESDKSRAMAPTPGSDASMAAGSPSAGQGDVGRSLVTIGKYLTPNLYISFGRSLFMNANLLRLRYKFSSQWELETLSGTTSGADIFYKIEFH